MKTFISWSGERSNSFAKALKDWLPDVLQGIEPWMSEHDIAAGSRWHQKLAEALEQTNFGILCVTPENQSAPWLIFEAGALSRSIKQTSVVPIILGMSPSDLKSPLSQFQSVESTTEGVFKLLQALNSNMALPLPPDRLNRGFNRCWPELQKLIISQAKPPEGTAAPSSRSDRDLLEEMLELTRGMAQTRQSAGDSIISSEDLHVDLRPICGTEGTIVSISASPTTSVADFLDEIYFAINRYGHIEAYTYGRLWLLKDSISGKVFDKMGRDYIRTRGRNRDERPIRTCGIQPGMRLIAYSPDSPPLSPT